MPEYIDAPSCQVPDLANLYLNRFGYITNGAFVEVGAFNGYNWSNTYGLAMAGWRGLLFEPQPDRCAECRTRYTSHPGIVVEQCCIGRENSEIALYLGGSLSTTKPETVETYNSLPWSQSAGLASGQSITCPVFTLDFMLEKHAWPAGFEVLVIDVEGAELDVLAGFTVDKWRPKMVIIEAHELYPDERLNGKAGPINDYFGRAGYEKIYSDYINSIFWRG